MADMPKKRPLFQLHLSTCVVLMLVAGGLLYPNIHWRTTELRHAFWLNSQLIEAPCEIRGWPSVAEYRAANLPNADVFVDSTEYSALENAKSGNWVGGIALVFLIGVFLEWRIRRERQRHG